MVSPLLHGANPPAEFLEIPWKAPAARAKEIMLRRADTKMGRESPAELVFEGGTFGGFLVRQTKLVMIDGQFFEGTVYLDIPPGTDKKGVLVRDLQFEKLAKSLGAKYGKGARSGDGNHTEENWKWEVTGLGNEKRVITIRLSYSWNPYEFLVCYANLAEKPGDAPATGTTTAGEGAGGIAPGPAPLKLPTPKRKDL